MEPKGNSIKYVFKIWLNRSKKSSFFCSLTLCASFSNVLILFFFDLISSSSNLILHFLYTWEFLKCLVANLKRINFGITFFFYNPTKILDLIDISAIWHHTFQTLFFNVSPTISVSDYICNWFFSRKSDTNDK